MAHPKQAVTVRQTVGGDYIVARNYNGEKVAGPFKSAGEAYQAMAGEDRPKARKKPEKPQE